MNRCAKPTSRWQQYRTLLILLGLLLGLQSLVECSAQAQQLLRLQLDLRWGEPWRWLTANLIHDSWPHLLLNAASLIAVVSLFPPLLAARHLLPAVLCTSLGVSLGLLWHEQPFDWYVGLSGALYGLLTLGVLLWHRSQPLAPLVALLVIGKIGWEQWQGAVNISEPLFSGVVATDAHLFGALSGVLIALACFSWRLLSYLTRLPRLPRLTRLTRHRQRIDRR